MEITHSGFNPQASVSAVSVSAQQQAAQQRTQAQTASAGRRLEAEQPQRNRSEQSQRVADSARVINGEVLASESSRVSPEESSYSFLGRSQQRPEQNPSSQPETRRIPLQQALQTFQQNQDMLPQDSQPRQVSGIIDVHV